MRVSARSYAQTKIRQAASATRGNRGEATGRDGGRETQTTAVSIDSLVQMEDLFALLVPLYKDIGARATRRRWSSERFFFIGGFCLFLEGVWVLPNHAHRQSHHSGVTTCSTSFPRVGSQPNSSQAQVLRAKNASRDAEAGRPDTSYLHVLIKKSPPHAMRLCGISIH